MNWTANKVRKTFIKYFESKGHKEVPSAPIVIKNDPTLLFTNAGMNQFKDYFLGNETPENKRVCDAQKCLRVSGKHNDLEEVGRDTYHHTMFEMLGNWSFGDYFKKDAVSYAWELLTKEFGIEKDRLYITVFGGDDADGVGSDREAEQYWSELVPKDRIMHFDKKDNFWEMGAAGPCGPASEIHVDIRSDEERKKQDAKELVNKDHPQVIEIWNLVFIEYNRTADGNLEPLPQKHVDTGMGLERLAMVLQNRQSNYDIDLFQKLIESTEKISGIKYGTDDERDVAIRVISDHIRAVAFCIADGQLPSNTGAGYVIRRILRRAVRYGFSFLGLNEPFFYKLVEPLTDEMGSAYPELKKQKDLITNVIKEEENSFLRTLDKGISKFNAYRAENSKTVDGKFAFELYDTYGFPIDLTMLLAAENSMTVDEEGFNKALSEQKKRSQDAGKPDAGDWIIVRKHDEMPEFIGYDRLDTPAQILRYREVKRKKKTLYQIVLDKTPFYPEGGGQVGDSGILKNANEQIKIFDTRRENKLIVHFSEKAPQNPEAEFTAVVDQERRAAAARNHTATHLLHKALRDVLGDHVEQKGSLVHPDYLRFDFSHFQKVDPKDLEKIEERVNRQILANHRLEENRNADPQEAIKNGALALFGEKYGDKVRVIQFGNNIELCGGTHVSGTGSLGLFKLTNETSVASGVRRVEAATGIKAYEQTVANEKIIEQVGELVKNPKNPVIGTEKLVEEKTELERTLESYKEKEKQARSKEIVNDLDEINGIKFAAKSADINPGTAKDIFFKLKKETRNTVIILGNPGKKVTLSLFISPDVTERYGLKAGEIIRDLAKHIKGGGGGQPFFATAGGGDANGLEAAYNELREMISKL